MGSWRPRGIKVVCWSCGGVLYLLAYIRYLTLSTGPRRFEYQGSSFCQASSLGKVLLAHLRSRGILLGFFPDWSARVFYKGRIMSHDNKPSRVCFAFLFSFFFGIVTISIIRDCHGNWCGSALGGFWYPLKTHTGGGRSDVNKVLYFGFLRAPI